MTLNKKLIEKTPNVPASKKLKAPVVTKPTLMKKLATNHNQTLLVE